MLLLFLQFLVFLLDLCCRMCTERLNILKGLNAYSPILHSMILHMRSKYCLRAPAGQTTAAAPALESSEAFPQLARRDSDAASLASSIGTDGPSQSVSESQTPDGKKGRHRHSSASVTASGAGIEVPSPASKSALRKAKKAREKAKAVSAAAQSEAVAVLGPSTNGQPIEELNSSSAPAQTPLLNELQGNNGTDILSDPKPDVSIQQMGTGQKPEWGNEHVQKSLENRPKWTSTVPLCALCMQQPAAVVRSVASFCVLSFSLSHSPGTAADPLSFVLGLSERLCSSALSAGCDELSAPQFVLGLLLHT